MSREQEYVLRTVEERGVRLIRLWFTDVLGQLKSVAISPAELEQVFNEGVQFDGTAIDGFNRVHEADVLARPDATTFELLPWAKADEPSGRMFCNIESLDDTPFEGTPTDPAAQPRRRPGKGVHLLRRSEAEFFYFESGETEGGAPKPIDHASYFDLATADVSSDLRKTTIHMLEAMASRWSSFHEDSPSQHEIDLRYTEALSMADNIMTLRLVVKKIAMDRGVYATFMPAAQRRAGLRHAHAPFAFEGETNAFHDADDEGLSVVGKQFTAGVLKHAREITAVTNQLVNSRASPRPRGAAVCCLGPQQPLGHDPVPVRKKGKPESARIEYRALDGAANPYLAFADPCRRLRIDEGYELPPETDANLFELSDSERRTLGVEPLPVPQRGARRDGGVQAARDTLGEHVFEWFLRNKRAEWAEFQSKVTPFELERYLGNW